jgi:hypothetical protein
LRHGGTEPFQAPIRREQLRGIPVVKQGQTVVGHPGTRWICDQHRRQGHDGAAGAVIQVKIQGDNAHQRHRAPLTGPLNATTDRPEILAIACFRKLPLARISA